MQLSHLKFADDLDLFTEVAKTLKQLAEIKQNRREKIPKIKTHTSRTTTITHRPKNLGKYIK